MNRPATASLHSATPKKNVPCFSDVVVVKFFLKKERTFFFGVLPSRSRAGGGTKCGLGFAEAFFWGYGFRKTSATIRISQAEEEGSGEESSACSIRFLLAKFGADMQNHMSLIVCSLIVYKKLSCSQ